MTKSERRRTHMPENTESLYFTPEPLRKTATGYFPCIYIEAGIDFNDVRTGYKGSVKLARALRIYNTNTVSGWADEIILDADLDKIQETAPLSAHLDPLPELVNNVFIDTVKNRYIEYLTRSWKKILYHNSELGIYSGEGESHEEFITRCGEQFSERMREDVERTRVVFNRMREQLKEKYLGVEGTELPESVPLMSEVSDKTVYSRYADYMAALFLNAVSSTADAVIDLPCTDKKSELEERLIALVAETRRKIAFLRETYEKKTDIVDEYILRPNLRNIHCERSCILWMARNGKPRKSEG